MDGSCFVLVFFACFGLGLVLSMVILMVVEVAMDRKMEGGFAYITPLSYHFGISSSCCTISAMMIMLQTTCMVQKGMSVRFVRGELLDGFRNAMVCVAKE